MRKLRHTKEPAPKMSDVFVSYARSTESQAEQVANVLRGQGYSVWRDDELPAHRSYGDVIQEQLTSAKAVVVLWSAEAAKSQWVRSEADSAREAGTLIQATVDGTIPPMPFNQIECANLQQWNGDPDFSGWRKLSGSVIELVGSKAGPADAGSTIRHRNRISVCVLPFSNVSDDREQEYFSDGISEDIITDLSKVSALAVVARNTSFTFKGRSVRVPEVARELNVSHVLGGSVRKYGNRVRITAQLIDGATGDHIWAERYDRDLIDIFAIQDEISAAIVNALKVKLLKAEKKAIEHRGTTSAEAYDLYLMARQYWVSGNDGDLRRDETIIRLCRAALDLDAAYARAWALLAITQSEMRFHNLALEETGWDAAEQALRLDPTVAEAHAVKASCLAQLQKHEEANVEIELALHANPDSWEVNKEVGLILYRRGEVAKALPFFRTASQLMDTDYRDASLLMSCCRAVGDEAGAREAAQLALDRTEKTLAQDRGNGSALGFGAMSLAYLGQADRAREWIRRAMLIDPDNMVVRLNLGVAMLGFGASPEEVMDFIDPALNRMDAAAIRLFERDPDLDPLRGHRRFERAMVNAKRRLKMSD